MIRGTDEGLGHDSLELNCINVEAVKSLDASNVERETLAREDFDLVLIDLKRTLRSSALTVSLSSIKIREKEG